MSRRRISPTEWLDEGSATPHRFSRAFAIVPAVRIPQMRPVIHAQYLENRHRSKPPNPLSIHRENRR